MPIHLKRPTIYYGWWVVGACSLIMLFAGGAPHYGFTAVFEPIAKEFRWSYTQISLAASLRGMETGLLSPFIGIMVDRWGPRRIVLGGCTILGLGMVLLSQITSLGTFYIAFILIAAGITSTGHAVTAAAVANWFKRRVSIAMGIMASGAALGGLMIPVVVVLIDRFQWRHAMLILGIATWVICLPLSLLVRHRPERYGYLTDGDAANPPPTIPNPPAPADPPTDSPVRVALRQRAFWHIALALTLQTMAVSAVTTHVMPYLSTTGITRSVAALVATGLPLTSILGRMSFGWFGDRFNKLAVSAVGFGLTAVGLLFFALVGAGGTPLLVLYLAFLGIGWGGNVTMRASLVREYFGRTGFGTVHGLALGIMTIGNIAGAPFVGWIYDRWHNYQGAWFILAALAGVALVVVATTPSPSRQVTLAEKPG